MEETSIFQMKERNLKNRRKHPEKWVRYEISLPPLCRSPFLDPVMELGARALGPQIWAKAGWDEDNGPPDALVTHRVAASLKSKIISEGTRYACMSQMVHHRRPVVLLLVLGETSEEDVDEQGEGVDMVTS